MGGKHGGHVSNPPVLTVDPEYMVRSLVLCPPVDGGKHVAGGVRVFR